MNLYSSVKKTLFLTFWGRRDRWPRSELTSSLRFIHRLLPRYRSSPSSLGGFEKGIADCTFDARFSKSSGTWQHVALVDLPHLVINNSYHTVGLEMGATGTVGEALDIPPSIFFTRLSNFAIRSNSSLPSLRRPPFLPLGAPEGGEKTHPAPARTH